MKDKLKAAQQTGMYIFLALLIATIFEYFVGAVENPSTVLLLIIALLKGALILWYFMHVYRVWREEAH